MTSKIKICFILHAPMGGGAERFMVNLVNHLSREQFDIHFILFNGQGEYAELINKDISVIDLKMNLPSAHEFTHPQWILKLGKTLESIQPDIVFSTLGYTNLMTLLAKIVSQISALIVIRETAILSLVLKQDRWAASRKSPIGDNLKRFSVVRGKFILSSAIKKRIYKWLYPKANFVVAPSPAIIEDLKSFIKIPSHKVISNFIDEHRIQKSLSESWEPMRYQLKTDRPVIISVGHLEKIKGLDVGLKAFGQLHQKIPSYYWILGSGQEETSLKQLAQELKIQDSTYFLGFQKNPYIFMAHADIFLLPSHSEGFPNALLESMYCGLGNIVTRYNRSIEDFIEDNIDGMIVEPGNVQSMAQKLEFLLTNKEKLKSLQENARKKVHKFYSQSIMKQYEEFFLHLKNNRHP